MKKLILLGAFLAFASTSTAFACGCEDKKNDSQKTAETKSDKSADSNKECTACKRKHKDSKNSKASEESCGCDKKDA